MNDVLYACVSSAKIQHYCRFNDTIVELSWDLRLPSANGQRNLIRNSALLVNRFTRRLRWYFRELFLESIQSPVHRDLNWSVRALREFIVTCYISGDNGQTITLIVTMVHRNHKDQTKQYVHAHTHIQRLHAHTQHMVALLGWVTTKEYYPRLSIIAS